MDDKPSTNRFEKKQPETSTSNKSTKKVEKVISGKVKTKKKSETRKLADVFLSEDIGNVKSYIIFDVLIPAAKKTVSEVIKKGIDMILYGDTSFDTKDSRATKVSYRSYFNEPKDRRTSSNKIAAGYNYDDVIFNSRYEAEEVLERMDELIETYDNVSVADFYDLVGITGSYTDNKYGWTDIRTAKVVRVSGDGYMIKLPKVIPL